jgi:hypothetical protein
MSSYKLQAKNKNTGEIVTVCAIDDYFGKHNYGYAIENPSRPPEKGYFFNDEWSVYTSVQFNELYDRVEDTTPQWKDKFYEQDMVKLLNSKDPIYGMLNIEAKLKMIKFIEDTLKAERMRIVGEIEKLNNNPYGDTSRDVAFIAGFEFARNETLKLINK